MQTLTSIVDAVLGETGLACRDGLIYRAEQHEYALCVARTLEAGIDCQQSAEWRTQLAFLEAATGIGKTVGYLVPLLAYSALTGERVAVSTFTRHLQHQILTEDFPQVQNWIAELTGVRIQGDARWGLDAFVSASRVARLVRALEAEGRLDDAPESARTLLQLQEWAECSLGQGHLPDGSHDGRYDSQIHTGLFADFVDQQGLTELPFDIETRMISINASDRDEVKVIYQTHVECSHAADVVFVTQAMLVLNSFRWFSILEDDRPLRAVVVDEADRLPSAAEQVHRRMIPLHKAEQLLQNAKGVWGRRLNKPLKVLAQLRENLQSSYRGEALAVLSASEDCDTLEENITMLRDSLSSFSQHLQDQLSSHDLRSAHEELIALELLYLLDDLTAYVSAMESDNDHSLMTVSWSPMRQYPSLQLFPMRPEQLLARFWVDLPKRKGNEGGVKLDALVLTSATIGVTTNTDEFSYYDFAASLGVYHQGGTEKLLYSVRQNDCRSFEPHKFGQLIFRLADPRLPAPLKKVDNELVLDKHEQPQFSREWLQYCVSMINSAHSEADINIGRRNIGNRTLVLTCSYHEAEVLAKKLRDNPHLIVHQRGTPLSNYLQAFVEDPHSILITSLGWEGVNLPNTIANLIITCLPFTNSDDVQINAKISALISRGVGAERAKTIVLSKYSIESRRKFKQGLGRPIRSVNGRARVWITDPRMTLPKSWRQNLDLIEQRQTREAGGFNHCIPQRFRKGKNSAFEQAKILRDDGVLVGVNESFLFAEKA